MVILLGPFKVVPSSYHTVKPFVCKPALAETWREEDVWSFPCSSHPFLT